MNKPSIPKDLPAELAHVRRQNGSMPKRGEGACPRYQKLVRTGAGGHRINNEPTRIRAPYAHSSS